MIMLIYFSIVFMENPEQEQELFKIGNEYREENGLEPFSKNSALDDAAKIQAKYCAETNNLTHDNEGEDASFTDRIAKSGYTATDQSENAAEMNTENASDPLEGWKTSPGHNSNLLGEFAEVGYASEPGSNDKVYWVGVYATGSGGENSGNSDGSTPEKKENTEDDAETREKDLTGSDENQTSENEDESVKNDEKQPDIDETKETSGDANNESSKPDNTSEALKTSNEDQEDELLKIGNEYRQENNLLPFERNSELDKAAKIQADYCANSNTLTHDNKGEDATFVDRIAKTGYNASNQAENAAEMNTNDAIDPLIGWKESPGHNKNLLGDYKEVGYASTPGSNDKMYWVGVYATKKEVKTEKKDDEKPKKNLDFSTSSESQKQDPVKEQSDKKDKDIESKSQEKTKKDKLKEPKPVDSIEKNSINDITNKEPEPTKHNENPNKSALKEETDKNGENKESSPKVPAKNIDNNNTNDKPENAAENSKTVNPPNKGTEDSKKTNPARESYEKQPSKQEPDNNTNEQDNDDDKPTITDSSSNTYKKSSKKPYKFCPKCGFQLY